MGEGPVPAADAERHLPGLDSIAVVQRLDLEVRVVEPARQLSLEHPDTLEGAGQHALPLGEELEVHHRVATRVRQRSGGPDEVAIRQPAVTDSRIELEQVGRKAGELLVEQLRALGTHPYRPPQR